jgi:UDP-N-acetylmuramoylalanine--D-glutamate ligase
VTKYRSAPCIILRLWFEYISVNQRFFNISVNQRYVMKNKKITVMGLGLNRGGLGVARFLARSGAKVLVTDLKSRKELAPSIKELKGLPIKYVLGRHRGKDFSGADLIIKNPAVPNNSPYLLIAKKHKVPIETDIGIFVRLCPSQHIVAVAGTKGKSTTASLIHHLLKSAGKDVVLAGNIGVSVFDALPFIKTETIVVLEISSWQLEGLKQIRFAPRTAVLTNILPDHLDRYRDFESYSNAEQLVYKYQNRNHFLILNQDQKIIRDAAKKAKAKIIWFSKKRKVGRGCFVGSKFILRRAGAGNRTEKIIAIKHLPLLGEHNLENVLAASAAAMVCGITVAATRRALRTFKGLPHRLEFIREVRGIRFYNDSAATTPDACLAALGSFSRPIILIAGGKNKKMPFGNLVKAIAENEKIKRVILLRHPNYDATETILKEAEKLSASVKFIQAAGMRQAVRAAFSFAKKGDIILLSPAAASFGMFKNEFDRGRQFIVSSARIPPCLQGG